MTHWPPFIDEADLAPGDRRAPAAACAELRLYVVESADDPWFEAGYRLLDAEFGAKGELESRDVLARRLKWRAEQPHRGHAMLYRMMLVFHSEDCVAVRDHTAMLREGGEELIVHISHVLVLPAWRGTGLAAIMRTVPLQTARACAAAAGRPGARITLVAEMEAWDAGIPERIVRMRSYERAGFRKIYPTFGYHQPDFRAAAAIDASGGPRVIPFELVIRRLGREMERHLAARDVHEAVQAIYDMYALGIRARDMRSCFACAKRLLEERPPEFVLLRPTGAGLPIPVFYHPGFAAPIGEEHIMPMRKFALVAERLRGPAAKLLEPTPIPLDDLRRVHTAEYVRAVETGKPRVLAESQKFPWSPQLFPAVRLTNGGVLAAARAALEHGVAACLASGFHHACADHGEGFCTFNGLVVALETLHAEGLIRHGAVLDMDLHYGNGTAELAATRPFLTVVSVYGSDYADNRPSNDVTTLRHHDGENHFSLPLRKKAGGAALDAALERAFPLLLQRGRPDVLLYQAGADPYREDPYSPLNLTLEDLALRDRRVFAFCQANGIPVAWVLAGGYTKDVTKVVQVHVNTFAACVEMFGPARADPAEAGEPAEPASAER